MICGSVPNINNIFTNLLEWAVASLHSQVAPPQAFIDLYKFEHFLNHKNFSGSQSLTLSNLKPIDSKHDIVILCIANNWGSYQRGHKQVHLKWWLVKEGASWQLNIEPLPSPYCKHSPRHFVSL